MSLKIIDQLITVLLDWYVSIVFQHFAAYRKLEYIFIIIFFETGGEMIV